MQRNITLLPREKYWRTAIQLRTTETHQVKGKNAEGLEKASREDTQFQEIQKALQTNQKELQGVALGLCQWKDNLLWYNNRIWVSNEEKIRTETYDNITIFLKLVTGKQLKLPNCCAEHITGQNYVMKSRDTSKTVTRAKG